MRASFKTVLGLAVVATLLTTGGGTGLYAADSHFTMAGEKTAELAVENTNNSDINNQQDETVKSQIQSRKLSIDEAIKLAEQNNINLKRLKIAYDNAIIENDKAHDLSRQIKDKYIDMNLDLAMAKYVNSKAKNLGEEKALRAYKAGKEQVLLGVRKKYYDILKAKDILSSKQAALERAKLQLKNAEAAYKAGTVAKTDLLQAQVGLYSAQADYTVAENNFKKAMIDLNKDIGLDPATHLELTTAVSMESMPEPADKDYEQIVARRLDVQNALADLEIAKETYDMINGYTAPNTYSSRQAKLDMQDKQEKLEDLKRSAKGEIQKAYMDLNAAMEGLKALDKAIELARENHRLAEMRYKVGVATSLDVITASENLANTEAKRISALYDFNLAKLQCEVVKITSLTATN